MTPTVTLLLASKSPRRQQLLAELGFPMQTVSIDVDESITDTTAVDRIAEALAIRKSEAFPRETLRQGQVLVTADTIVALDGKMMGKPHNRENAIAMLSALSGRCHIVYTGVCLKTQRQTATFTEATKVYFKNLATDDIAHYIDTCKPFDKAGAYGIQEWIGMTGIERIEGCYYNVMGLPLSHLYDALKGILPSH